ncbi:MAG: hypothetical protein EBX40_00680 [Gammaproteobacteria bacterium]|nr:hypothetical protein [Gammaproteobacteria bacterium]
MILPITVKAPGKLILSGEHAVVYGSPALATAVNCYTTVHLVPEPGEIGFFDFPDLGFKASFGAPALALLLQKLNSRLAAFTAQKISVKALLDHPAELLLYAAGLILEQAGFPPVGFKCTLSSTIPMSAGMGSSGSSIVAIQYAFKESLGCEINTDDFLALALKAEQLQHGRSSGLDLKLAYHGGIQFSDQGVLHPRSYSLPDLAIVNTGKPKSSTGECVMQAQPFFKNQPELLSAFADTTRNIDRARPLQS